MSLKEAARGDLGVSGQTRPPSSASPRRMATAMSMGLVGFGTATATRRGSARTSIGLVTVLVGVVILGSVTDATAWGSKGHRIIGLIARELLLPETSAEIETIMGTADLATFGVFLDEDKDRLDVEVPGSRAWHYDNIPICGRKGHSEYCPNGWCASTQIARHRDILADAQESKARKQFAIWVLTHLIADIHQPLHAADRDDRGGNAIKVRLPWGATPISMGPGTLTSSNMPSVEETRSSWPTISSSSSPPERPTGRRELSRPGWTNRTNSPRPSPTERLRLHVRCRPQARADLSRSELCRRGHDRRRRAVDKGGISTGLCPQS